MYQVSEKEEAVTVEVSISGRKIAAVLDTGARLSVMDVGTLRRLGLEDEMVVVPGRVYGLCNNPVRVRGYLEVAIQVGTNDALVERVQVLDSTDPTLLLGRGFMGRLGSVTFDWAGGRVRLGRTWVAARCLLRRQPRWLGWQ